MASVIVAFGVILRVAALVAHRGFDVGGILEFGLALLGYYVLVEFALLLVGTLCTSIQVKSGELVLLRPGRTLRWPLSECSFELGRTIIMGITVSGGKDSFILRRGRRRVLLKNLRIKDNERLVDLLQGEKSARGR